MVRSLPARSVACLFALLISISPSPLRAAPHVHVSASIFDNDDHMDVNNINMTLTNHGSIAFDLQTAGPGLEFPNGTGKTAVYASGLWIGAQVNDTVRVAMGEYVQEYAPGPMIGGTFAPDQIQFHNFRIEQGGLGYSDYLADAVPQGAPLDSLGHPLLLGDALTWSVFNDANPALHVNAAGSTAPLGVEVQQSVFAFRRSGALGNVVFVKWRLQNKGTNQLQNAYVSFWADPDLGDASDDLVGCDTTMSLGYCYNASNLDAVYGSAPPAVGFHMLRGAVSNGTQLGMTSFHRYINGGDPQNPVEIYNHMSGRKADGSPVHVCDDDLLPVTTYEVSGLNPESPSNCFSNWLDSNSDDRRLFLSSGPFTMMPGDTQVVVIAIEVGQSTDQFASIQELRNIAAVIADLYNATFGDPSTAVASQVVDSRAEAGVNHVAWYVPASPGTPITIQRRTASSPWAAVSEATLPTDRLVRFDDVSVAAGERYGYRLEVWSGATQDYTAETWLQAAPTSETPTSLRLLPARPNPSTGVFQIRHYVPRRESVRLTLVDIQGRVVRVLSNRESLPGWYDSSWNGRDSAGRAVASGTYFLRLEDERGVETKKLVLMR